MESLTGAVLASRYRVGQRLGAGGMSVVYDGVDVSVGRPVAIKILRDGQALARFEREARLLARLAHPNIVTMSDFRNVPGEPPFIVMERLVGESLGALLKRTHALDAHRTTAIAIQILAALDAAHAQGVIHRDIKPDNIFLCDTGGPEPFVKVLDFGIARPLEGATLEALTQSGGLLGSVAFMAPEQVLAAPVGPRTDLYALGATMYRMLAAHPPFEGSTVEVLTAIATRSPPPPQNADAGLASIITRAMERDPNARFATARDMMAALLSYASPPKSKETSLGVWIFASTLVFVIGALATAAFAWSRRAPSVEAPAAATSAAPVPVASLVAIPARSDSLTELAPTASTVVVVPTATKRTSENDVASRPTATATATATANVNNISWAVSNVIITSGSVTVSGSTPETTVRSNMESDFFHHKMCYGRTYGPGNTPEGSVAVGFDVIDGLARHVRLVSSTFNDASFESCVVRMTGGLIVHGGGETTATVTYQMTFRMKR